MSRAFLFLLCFVVSLSVGAQAYTEAWRNRHLITDSGAANSFSKLVKTPGGDMIAAGQFDGDVLIARIDSSGNIIWRNIIQGTATGRDNVADLVLTSGGLIYVTGVVLNAISSDDILTACIDLNGNLLWKAEYNGIYNSSDFGQSLSVDNAGNVFVCANIKSGPANTDGIILAYTPTGTLNWSSLNSGSANGNDNYVAIVGDNNGRIYVAGYEANISTGTDAVLTCLTTSGTILWTYMDSTSASDSYKDVIYDQGELFLGAQFGYMKIIKLDTAGNWAWTCNCNIAIETCQKIKMDPAGRIIGIGYSNISSDTRIQVVAVSISGTVDWLSTYTPSLYVGNDLPVDVQTDSIGNIFVTGQCQTSTNVRSELLLKISVSGTILWNRTRTGNFTGFMIQTSSGIVVYPDRVVTGGVIKNIGTSDDATITEYNFSGTLLYSFTYDWSHGDTRDPILIEDVNGNILVGACAYSPDAIVLAKYSQAGQLLWADSVLMPASITAINITALCVDSAGNIFVGAIASTSTPANQDLWIGKFTSTGDSIWTRRYTSPGNHQETCTAIACDENGNVYVCGRLWDGSYSAAGIIKYDANGNIGWTRILPGATNNSDGGVDICISPDTTLYFLASIYHTTTGLDFYLEKLTLNGDTIWTSVFSSPGNLVDIATGLVVFPNSDIAMYGTIDNFPLYRDIQILKYSSSGTSLWSSSYNNPGGSEQVADAVLGGTNIYLTGSLYDGIANYDFLIGAVDSTGSFSWVSSYAGSQNLDDEGYGIAWNAATHEIIATGYSRETGYLQDYITLVLDTTGMFLDTMRIPNVGNEISAAILTPSVGAGVYVCGNVTAITANGSSNILLVKYCNGPVVSAASALVGCPGDTVQLFASTGFTYSWYPSNSLSSATAQNPFAFPTSLTTYSVSATNIFGCVSSANQQVIINQVSVTASPSMLTLCNGDTAALSAGGATSYNWQPVSFLSNPVGASTLAWPTSSQTYFVTGNTPWGCSAIDSIQITVVQPPAVSFSLPIDTFCISSGTYMLASGVPAGGLYTGQNVSGNIFFAVSPGYTMITYTYIDSITGCDASASDSMNVVLAPVVFFAPALPDTVCLSASPITLTNGSPLGGIYSGPGVTGNQFNPLVAGIGAWNIVYTYSDGNNCVDSVSGQIIVDLCTTINETAIENQIIVYPNPSTETISVSGLKANTSLMIYDVVGKVMYMQTIVSEKAVIDITSFSNGIYFLQIKSEDGLITKKIIKEN